MIKIAMKAILPNLNFTCLLVMAALSGSLAYADDARPDSGKPGRGHRDGGKPGERFKAFKDVDVNKDGALSFEEFSSMSRLKNMDESKRRKLFDFLDRDKDGKLHMRELQPREPKWIGALRKEFAKVDANKDGSLDLAEFSKLPFFKDKDQEMVKKIFEKADRNKNQKIDRQELKFPTGSRQHAHLDFAKYDKNSSGGLDFQEYSAIPWMKKCPDGRRKKLFDRIDADKNGEISQKEIRAAHQIRRPSPHRGGRAHDGKGRPTQKPHGKPRRDGPHGKPGERPEAPSGTQETP